MLQRLSRSAILSLLSFSLAQAASPIAAFALDQTQSQSFQLRAQVLDHVGLTRADLDPAATAALAPPRLTRQGDFGTNQLTNMPNAQRNQGLSQPLAMGTPSSGIPQSANQPDNSFMNEYNVDWSHWMSHVADRWYYILKTTEESFGLEFVTARPALIQFTCMSNGQISNISIKQTSGNPAYDQLQMVALMETVPLPAFPQGTKRTSITLVQGWESHVKREGEIGYVPGSFGKGYPLEKVRQWIKAK